MPALSFRFKGLDSVKRKLDKLKADMDKTRIPRALREIAESVMTESKKDHVPVDDGPLRSSGKVDKVKKTGDEYSVALTYGGAAVDYALAVHEHMSVHSPPSWKTSKQPVRFHPSGHGPKYLEIPVVNRAATFKLELAQKLRV